MARLGIDPWNDEFAQRIEHAKQTIRMLRRSDPPFEGDHFPKYTWRQK